MSTLMICIILFVLMLLLLFLNTPLVVAIGLPTALIMQFGLKLGLPTLAQRSLTSIDSFTLMAVPLFMLAGKIMEHGGMSRRIIRMADCLIGWVSGGLAHVVILASAFFGALTGSSVACCAAIGSILIPEMKAKKYPAGLVAGLQSVAAILGVIIPPSISMIIYGVITGTSVGDLFIAGIVPGLFIALCLMIAVSVTFKVKKIEVEHETFSWKKVWAAFKDSYLALIMPVIIMGGIYSGNFTPTEAGAIACVYGFIICAFVYKEITWETMHEILGGTITLTSFCMIIVTASNAFSWLLVRSGVSGLLSNAISAIAVNKVVFLILANLIFIAMGMFIEGICAILMITPILMPTVYALGIDPIHFGLIMIINISLGLTTPPVGENQYIVSKIAGIPFEEEVKGSIPFLITGYVALFIITFVPQITLWLPNLFK